MRRPFDLSLYLVTDRAMCARLGIDRVVAAAVAGGVDAQESHPTLAAAQRWLDEHPDAPGALRRLVVEHTDALRRSLRVQAAQPAG